MHTSVRAPALATVLDQAPEGLEWLSLDCFDTLLWRGVHAPVDVFSDLGVEGGIDPRGWAELEARDFASLIDARNEITLKDVYRYLMPAQDDAARDAGIAHELAMEARHCFGFAPVRDLIANAKARGLKIMIVSDTYLRETELRALLDAAAGYDVTGQVDRIFCSSEYGTGKGDRLFTHVLTELGVSPGKILHIGDNKKADVVSPGKLGINTVHFEQFAPDVAQRLRLEALAATLVDRSVRVSTPIHQHHRAQMALRTETDPAYAIGHDVIGPIMHGFAGWVKDEADAMEARVGKTPKLVFLLRDGYLPKLAFEALFPALADRAVAAEISRFTATACSFIDADAIAANLVPGVQAKSNDLLAKQLGLTRDEAAGIVKRDDISFIEQCTGPLSGRIIKRSAAFLERMVAYLNRLGIHDGDAVMFVDIGYNGTVQNALEPALRKRMGLEVAGRYLALRQVTSSTLDKRGYLDARNYDAKLLSACYESIGMVEEFVNLAQGSVVDYKADGTPVRAASAQKEAQNGRRDAAQRGCLNYVAGARDHLGMVRRPTSDDAEARRHAAVASLVRFLYMPLTSEMAVIDSFHHDIDLGSSVDVRLVDHEAAGAAMRRSGMFYGHDVDRIYLPGELQRHGMHFNLAMLAARRFGLDLRKSDFQVGAIKLPVLLLSEQGHSAITIDAYPTVEGYYQAQIPVGQGKFSAGIQFGQLFDWVQIEQLCFHKVADLMKETLGGPPAIPAQPLHDGMTAMDGGLFQCTPAGFTLAQPPAVKGEALVLNLVFRPIVTRGDAAAKQNPSRKAA